MVMGPVNCVVGGIPPIGAEFETLIELGVTTVAPNPPV